MSTDNRQAPHEIERRIQLGCLLLALAPAIFAMGSPAHRSPLAGCTQLVVVTSANWSAVDGVLQRYERATPKQPWQAAGDPIPVVVGQTGLGWGRGFLTLPTQHEDPVKHEGDRRAPAGIFTLGPAFGYAPEKPAGWTIPYLTLTPSVECVDDPHSRFYNRVVHRESVAPDWNSSEHMRSVSEYQWGMVVDQNPGAVPGSGSCVFLHIRGGSDGGGTVGCTAMAEPRLETLLAWLQPTAHPLLVQMPLPQYRRIEKAFRLPSR